MTEKQNKVIMIIGAGRTGTSLLARILIALGMTETEQEFVTTEHNPEGVFEDLEVVEVHKNIFSTLNTHPYFPLPSNFLDIKSVNKYVSQLRGIVKARVLSAKTIWGIKDPRTASLLPLWSRVLNPLKLVPVFILSIRNPASAVASMHRQFNDHYEIAELVWLVRTCDALHYSGGNCFIVHYEDWFGKKSEDLAQSLYEYSGLEKYGTVNADDVLKHAVNKNLNRSQFEEYEVKNKHVKMLYQALTQCHGNDYDRDKLMSVVRECRDAIRDYSGWVIEAQHFYKQNQISSNNLTENKGYKDKLNRVLQKDQVEKHKKHKKHKRNLKKLILQSNNYLKELKEKNDEIKNLKIHINYGKEESKQIGILKEENKQIGILKEESKKIGRLKKGIKRVDSNNRKLEKENFELKTSVSFRIGQLFVNAIAKPGVNTILLPYNFLKITLEYLFVRKHL